jgi:hypothetical protein
LRYGCLKLLLHTDARDQLAAIKASDPDAHATILAVLLEIKGDPELLDSLTDHGFATAAFDVKKWVRLWDQGKDIWRLKVFDFQKIPLPYRVVYAYSPSALTYYVLAILSRDFNYEIQHPATQRILEIYAAL